MITRIVLSYSEPRRRAQAGDIKIARGKTYVRQQQMCGRGGERAYVVRNGRPQFEWVPEADARDTHRTGWVQPRRRTP